MRSSSRCSGPWLDTGRVNAGGLVRDASPGLSPASPVRRPGGRLGRCCPGEAVLRPGARGGAIPHRARHRRCRHRGPAGPRSGISAGREPGGRADDPGPDAPGAVGLDGRHVQRRGASVASKASDELRTVPSVRRRRAWAGPFPPTRLSGTARRNSGCPSPRMRLQRNGKGGP